MAARITGRGLNDLWRVRARHALYHRPGTWYHLRERFPVATYNSANGFYIGCHLYLQTEELEYVAETILDFCGA